VLLLQEQVAGAHAVLGPRAPHGVHRRIQNREPRLWPSCGRGRRRCGWGGDALLPSYRRC
jgi:hypothetical protein